MTVLIRALVRSTTHHEPGTARLGRVKAIVRALRVVNQRASGIERLVLIVAVPVGAPLPAVGRHVGEAAAVGGECADGCRLAVAVLVGVLVGDPSLPQAPPYYARTFQGTFRLDGATGLLARLISS